MESGTQEGWNTIPTELYDSDEENNSGKLVETKEGGGTKRRSKVKGEELVQMRRRAKTILICDSLDSSMALGLSESLFKIYVSEEDYVVSK